MSRAIVIMGPAGAGKTAVGKALARRLSWKFVEGDDLHPQSNRKKMAAGIPLNDADRKPWLDEVAEEILVAHEIDEDVIVACSALKEAYRHRLRVHDEVTFVFLDAPLEVLEKRLAARKGHFMPASLLPSQLSTLERPDDGITIDASRPVPDIIEDLANRL